ncbi:sensor histidine kinase [Jiangella alkaliphila]|uniref:histidine kinase n=1 Tax=Jiangella alkaliphila TaxID=419479 RepID=A0A1H2KVD3_9ACTN|nr:HAMP domain-containing sensor histidine kinase [Jiangella alkaliphila]SDU72660.1 His Kinase A (phospho-acceptor) domain-containing protein [Jiangella alkaliphila]
MSRAWRSLRVRLAVLGFLAIYLPVLLLYGVTAYTEYDATTEVINGVEITTYSNVTWSPWVTGTVLALAPGSAYLAWWWSGRAVRRYEAMYERLRHAADAQRRLIEETSHELRIPLSVLATNAEVLLAHPAPTLEVYRDGLERSGRAATRLRAVIDELLVDARGRARTIDRQPADVAALVRAVVDDARVVAAPGGVTVTVTAPPRVVAAVDEATVRRAAANLLDNAVRHAPPGSVVDVMLERHESDRRGDVLAIVVTDHGPGIPSAELAHVFEPFWHGDGRDGPGTGLGLPIARQIALAHGGDITLTSPGPAGDGCVAELTLRG